MDVTNKLTNWYSVNKRNLPWRKTKDPYYIWLSEIIMQQTRISQGTKYYHAFTETYPTVKHLASANLDDVLKLWEGLGYYSRARNLHKGANQIIDDFDGVFPDTYAEIIKIKGVGPYTAAAISSICFGEKKAVVDGNVFRFLARFYGIDTPINSTAGKKQFQIKADVLISTSANPGDFNQAMMEFGAMQCTPKNPNCLACIFNSDCAALQTGLVEKLPVKTKAKPLKNRFFNYLVCEKGQDIAIIQRNENDIWSHLYEFPLVETDELLIDKEALLNEEATINSSIFRAAGPIKHILSHQRLHITFWRIKSLNEKAFEGLKWVPISSLSRHAMPIVLKRFVDANLLPLPHRP